MPGAAPDVEGTVEARGTEEASDVGIRPARRTRRGEDAIGCLREAVRAVEPDRLVARFLEENPDALGAGPVRLAAFGKAAGAMARGAAPALEERLERGVVVVPVSLAAQLPEEIPDIFRGSFGEHLRLVGAGHPHPNQGSVRGGEAIRALAEDAGEDDVILVLVSGGGSALLTLPPEELSLDDVRATTELLQRAGADIDELNCVRKHLDQLKGGRLARIAAPARMVVLVLSDVVGDPLDVIASGPFSPDTTDFADAADVIDHYGLWRDLPQAVVEYLRAGVDGRRDESPGAEDPCFRRVSAHVVGNNQIAADATLDEAERRGYHPLLLTTTLTGEARQAGRFLSAIGRQSAASGLPVKRPAAILAAGETTVTVTGDGRGGRNQEVALGAALALDGEPGITLAALGTDGIDGPTDAAGAVIDGRTARRGRENGLDPSDHLERNDAYTFFRALDDLIMTGPTGTNVMDLTLVLVGDP